MPKRLLLFVLSVALLTSSAFPSSRGHSSSFSHTRSSSSHSSKTKTARVRAPRTKSSSAALRDSRGRIRRSAAAKDEFERETGYTHGRKGYVVDHIVPLACGGADAPSNMQWQTTAEAKAKDKTERIGCK
jgi:5-methylcytosine-specific restriction endonuclease McrA